ncbi:unnamed protein product [Ambrosiozyma monospora]|uniref:Unnamed protein product n=1 Tax=Ambrosiozyma monospora TaxID=43982 RepID=A0A9W6T502_AMBMO|nr:unnamed protein product [Ambrosiozyma monospora]
MIIFSLNFGSVINLPGPPLTQPPFVETPLLEPEAEAEPERGLGPPLDPVLPSLSFPRTAVAAAAVAAVEFEFEIEFEVEVVNEALVEVEIVVSKWEGVAMETMDKLVNISPNCTP